ncbi:MAG: hypothetical protein GQ570_06535 [Helicobacteraceae bacterium]|nr:hypothetical protein [Helicobacteraceae bacterium]
MLKKNLLSTIAAIAITVTSVQATNDYDLKTNMQLLNAELSTVRDGFITGDNKTIKEALKKFSENARDLLSNKEHIKSMLPKDVAYKANIAVNASKAIDKNVGIIEEMLNYRNTQSTSRKNKNAQEAFLAIERACFSCHSLVRDYGKK